MNSKCLCLCFRQQMPSSTRGQLTIEKTPSYFITSDVPERIKNMSRDVRLLLVVRDPVTRAVSDYAQAKARKPELPRFEQLAFSDANFSRVNTSWGAIRISLYSRHVDQWLLHFSRDQLLFINGEDLIRNPGDVMRRVQSFLQLDAVISQQHFSFNSSKGFPCLLKPKDKGRAHCLTNGKGRAHPELDSRALESLRRFFQPFNELFFSKIGQRFEWD